MPLLAATTSRSKESEEALSGKDAIKVALYHGRKLPDVSKALVRQVIREEISAEQAAPKRQSYVARKEMLIPCSRRRSKLIMAAMNSKRMQAKYSDASSWNPEGSSEDFSPVSLWNRPMSIGSSLRSEFSASELNRLSKTELLAVARAEHRQLVRAQLNKLQLPKEKERPDEHGDGQYRSKPDLAAPPSTSSYYKSFKALGHLGYEQLPLKPLAPIDTHMTHEKLSGTRLLAMPDVISKKATAVANNSINATLKRIVAEIDKVTWLTEDERESVVNTFISDLALRYHQIEDIMIPTLSPQQNRTLVIKTFERIGAIKSYILEKLRKQRIRMESAAVFGDDANNCRIASLFRTELSRNIDTTQIMKYVIEEVHRGFVVHEVPKALTRQELFKIELQQLKDALDAITHPTPVLHRPIISVKLQPTVMRRNLMNAQSMSYLEAAELEIAANKAKGKKGERKHQLTDETALQYNLVNTDLASLLNLKKHADTGDEDADEPDESLLLSQGDLGIVDPILQSHPRFVRRKTRRPVITKIPPRKRYLQPSKIREEHLTSFNYSSVDEQFLPSFARKQSMFFPPTQVDHFGESIQTVFSDTKMVVRSMDSRVSGRMPQGFITLSVEPASEITDFGQDLDSNLKENLDERLTQYKEVEELYDEIMKTVVGSSYWEGEEAEQDSGIITPAAPFDNALTMSYAYQGLAPPPPTSHQDIEAEQISRATNISERREHFGSEIALGPLPNQKPKYDDTVRANINGEFDTPEVRMNPRLRDVMVQPDDFINDRMLAMKKTPSSKYGVFKYNYGGYIPFDFEQRRQMHNVPFGPDDYLGWLRSRACDFVADLLIDDLDDEEKFKREMEEQRRLQKIKEETERVEKFKLEKVERRKRLLHFEKGMWNPGIIEYMEEIRESDGDDDVPAPKSFTPQSPLSAPAPGQPEIDLGTAGSQPGDKPAAEDGAADQDNEALLSILDDSGSDSEPGDEDKERHQKEGLEQIQENGESEPNEPNSADQPLPTPADGKRVKFFNQETFTQKAAEDNVGKIQGELERLWRALYMPLDQKLDMAIKYGSHKFISKLETALKLWRSVSEHIQTRETLLIDIEAFERTASDPARFFRRGHDGSSEARLAEARAREDLMRKLHYVEARIHDVVSLIKLELNETVTYKGAPYIEKMKYDYTEILQKVAQEREERERQQRAEATPSPSKSPFGRSMSRPSRK